MSMVEQLHSDIHLEAQERRLSLTLFNELRRRNKKYGLVTACVGGGQGVAGMYEMIN